MGVAGAWQGQGHVPTPHQRGSVRKENFQLVIKGEVLEVEPIKFGLGKEETREGLNMFGRGAA